MKWPDDAESYCRNRIKVKEIIHENPRYYYNLSHARMRGRDIIMVPSFRSDAVVALFDADGFVISTIANLPTHWGLGYFPDGIKQLPGYVPKQDFLTGKKG